MDFIKIKILQEERVKDKKRLKCGDKKTLPTGTTVSYGKDIILSEVSSNGED